ncbi:repair protein RAD16 [Aspergillus sp. HF37]|nr:repair protein RAD16 [Aspergillus sp. HF37]
MAEDTSGDGANDGSTPGTSVAVTPAASDVNTTRKRVSATARAQELRTLINRQRGLKRSSGGISAEAPATETSDANMARDLQLREYQKPSKRQRVSTDAAPSALEILNSTEDEEFVSEPEGWCDFEEDSLRGMYESEEASLASDDELGQDGADRDDSEHGDSASSTPPTDHQPVHLPQRQRNRNLGNRRGGRGSRGSRARTSTRGLSTLSCPPWMSHRAFRERQKLEKQHPSVPTMWETLKKSPPITPVAAPQPQGISRALKPFQLEGLSWMLEQEKTQYKGGLLGDEMGMGKTIQAVSLLMSDYPAGAPSLVVVPPVALMQWQSEIKDYTSGQLKVLVYHNSNSKIKNLKKKDIQSYDVIMISYSGLESIHRKEWKGWNRNDGILKEDSVIHSVRYHRLILDEAHSIKQRTASVARACFALKATYKWCLSGTPVQNRIGEFFSLLRFLEIRPFACYFCKQCKCQQLHWSQDAEKRCTNCKHSGFSHVSIFNQEILNPITESNNSDVRKDALSKLRLITDRIMLRRMKRDHTASMELPPKRVVLHNEFFGEIERDFSNSIMTNSTRQFDRYVNRGVMLNNYANIFGLIMQMRQVSNHPDLILKKHAQSGQNVLVCGVCDEPAEEAIRSRCHHEFCRRCAKDYIRSFEADTVVDCPRCHIPLSIDFEQPDIEQEEEHVKKNSIINRIRMEDWTSSTKIEMLVYELYKLRSKKQTHKSIVFSQFTSMLQLVEWRLRRAGFNTVMLDGTMTPSQRQNSIDYFMNNVDVEVFLVSLKAGGVALNLTEASRVFIVDPWWNPAAEWQSADRCHRIGQRRPCVITRLCIEDSVESRIVLLQEKKANLINGTINKDQGEALEKLTPEDMQFLFRG